MVLMGVVLSILIGAFLLGLPDKLIPTAFGLNICLLLAVVWKAQKIGITLRSDAIELANLVGSRSIPWEELKSIEIRWPWRLWQTWDSGIPALTFVSKTGTETIADATINLNKGERDELLRRLRSAAKNHGFQLSFSDADFERI